MLNKRTQNIGIESYYVPKNTASNHQYYLKITVSPPLESASDVKECGCYIEKENDESCRIWATYSIYHTIIFVKIK